MRLRSGVGRLPDGQVGHGGSPLAMTYYLWAVIGTRSLPRLAGIAALVLAGGLSSILAPYGALGLLATLLLVLAVIVVRDGHASSSRLLPHRQT